MRIKWEIPAAPVPDRYTPRVKLSQLQIFFSLSSFIMAEDFCATRDQPFRDLLLSVSKQLSESDNVEGLRYLADLGHSPSCSALELLKAMRNKGMFSPHFCSPLAELLRKIERHDLADEVMNKYVAVFPDQGKSEIFHLFYNRILHCALFALDPQLFTCLPTSLQCVASVV